MTTPLAVWASVFRVVPAPKVKVWAVAVTMTSVVVLFEVVPVIVRVSPARKPSRSQEPFDRTRVSLPPESVKVSPA